MAKVLYIAGAGRSGSTVLGIVLGGHPKIVNLGEVSFLFEDVENPARLCSCGRSYYECEFWAGWVHGYSQFAESAQIVRKIERAWFLPRLLLGMVGRADRTAYRDSQTRLFDYVVSRTGARVIVDGSKSALATIGRVVALRAFAGQQVQILHLVRNGLATLESVLTTGSNWELEGHRPRRRWRLCRGVLTWTMANLFSILLGHYFGVDRYIRVRYEDLIVNPEESLKRIGMLLGLDLKPLAVRLEQEEEFSAGHVVGGNRLRFDQAIRLRKAIRTNGCLTRPQRLVFLMMAGWLNRHLGYCKH